MKKTYIIVLYLLTFAKFTASSQPSTLHLAQNVIGTGKKLQYALYSTTTAINLLLFQLNNTQGECIMSWYNTLEQNTCYGEIKIPHQISSGNYYITAHKTCSANNHIVACSSLYIFSPFDYTPYEIDQFTLPRTNQEKQIKLKYEHTSEYLKVVNTTKDTLLFSLSITEQTPFDKILDSTYLVTHLPTNVSTENTSLHIKGKLIDTTSRSVTILASYADTSTHFSYAHTLSNGSFTIPLDKSYMGKKVIIQALNNTDKISIDSIIKRHKIVANPVQLTANQQNYIQQRVNRHIVDNIYCDTTIKASQTRDEISSFYANEATRTYPSDYLKFDSFEDLCNNILKPVRYRNNNLAIIIEGKIQHNKCLVFINNIPCFNPIVIKNLDPTKINYIDVLNQVVMYDNLTFEGIISIFTQEEFDDDMFFKNPYATLHLPCSSAQAFNVNNTSDDLPTASLLTWHTLQILAPNDSIKTKYTPYALGYNYKVSLRGVSSKNKLFKSSYIIPSRSK